MTRARGLDVSGYQDPAAMRYHEWRDELGLCFGYYRLMLGKRLDPRGLEHRARMRAAGYLTGPYGVIVEYSDILEQVELFVQNVPPDDELPDWLDVERLLLTWRMVRAWCDRYDAISRRTLAAYTGRGIWHQIIPFAERPRYQRYGVTIAAYPHDAPSDRPQPMDPVSVALRSNPPANIRPGLPEPWTDYLFWQHTGHGRLPGYGKDLDLNVFNGTEDELRALVGLAPGAITPFERSALEVVVGSAVYWAARVGTLLGQEA